MKKSIRVLVLFAISLAFVVSSCNKENVSSKEDSDMLKSAAFEEAELLLSGDGDFERVITKPLVKIDDCLYIVEGTIEFRKGDIVIATIDFGDGVCDDVATKTVKGETVEFLLTRKSGDKKFYKVIAEPLVKLEDCNYIVAGVIEFYSKKDNSWLATIDFGDGTCDEWATKTWPDGSKEFSMKDWKGK